MPAVDDMFTIDPRPPRTIAASSRRRHRNVLRRLPASAASKSASERSARAFGWCPPPALLKATSNRPYSSSVRSKSRSTDAASVTSVLTAIALPPAATMSRATPARSLSVRAASTTRAPAAANRRAVSAPMPRLAPVTSATRPSKRLSGIRLYHHDDHQQDELQYERCSDEP